MPFCTLQPKNIYYYLIMSPKNSGKKRHEWELNQLPTYSKLIVNHYTNKPLSTVTTIVHMTIYFIYHPPSEHMGRDISTPLHSRPARKYHVPSEHMGWDISTPLHSGPARKYHMPSECMGWDISTPLHSGPAGKYHVPSECMGQDICTPLPSRPARKYHMPLGTRVHGPSSVSQVIYH